MSSYQYSNKIYQTEKSFLTATDLALLLQIKSSRTLEDITAQMLNQNLLTALEKGKYFITNRKPSIFAIAQFLYSPSYISFETALNYHGLLSQFPVEITSATTKKKVEKIILGSIYSYAKINNKLFRGYYKEDNFLIALPEKALFDQLYMICKSLRPESILAEIDYSNIDKQVFTTYLNLVSLQYANKIKSLLEKYL